MCMYVSQCVCVNACVCACVCMFLCILSLTKTTRILLRKNSKHFAFIKLVFNWKLRSTTRVIRRQSFAVL